MQTALAVVGLLTVVSLVLGQPTSALVCVREWADDAYAGARDAAADPTRWDGLLIGTVTAVERKDDYWRTRVLVVEPEIVFSGSIDTSLRAEIGGHGPDLSFVAGSTYFLALGESGDAANPDWFVHPCGPSMAIVSSEEVAELRSISEAEMVISEPMIRTPPIVPLVGAGIAIVALFALWFIRRRRRSVVAVEGT